MTVICSFDIWKRWCGFYISMENGVSVVTLQLTVASEKRGLGKRVRFKLFPGFPWFLVNSWRQLCAYSNDCSWLLARVWNILICCTKRLTQASAFCCSAGVTFWIWDFVPLPTAPQRPSVSVTVPMLKSTVIWPLTFQETWHFWKFWTFLWCYCWCYFE